MYFVAIWIIIGFDETSVLSVISFVLTIETNHQSSDDDDSYLTKQIWGQIIASHSPAAINLKRKKTFLPKWTFGGKVERCKWLSSSSSESRRELIPSLGFASLLIMPRLPLGNNTKDERSRGKQPTINIEKLLPRLNQMHPVAVVNDLTQMPRKQPNPS